MIIWKFWHWHVDIGICIDIDNVIQILALSVTQFKSPLELKVSSIYQGGLNKKKIELNLCEILSILIFNELYLFA